MKTFQTDVAVCLANLIDSKLLNSNIGHNEYLYEKIALSTVLKFLKPHQFTFSRLIIWVNISPKRASLIWHFF